MAQRTKESYSANIRDTFLYARQEADRKAPFEVVLDWSTQKQILAEQLAGRIRRLNDEDELAILDIGSSKGTLIGMLAGLLIRGRFNKRIQFSLLEPDESSVTKLLPYAESIQDHSAGRFSSTVIREGWEEFTPKMYDAIICSHVIYHFDPNHYKEIFLKMVKALKPEGHLFVSAREGEGNDVFEFIREYKKLAANEQFNTITIADAIPALERIVSTNPLLSMEQNRLYANVMLPFASKPEDAKTIAAFFLQRPSWDALPAQVRDSIQNKYGSSDTILSQTDRLIEITHKSAPH